MHFLCFHFPFIKLNLQCRLLTFGEIIRFWQSCFLLSTQFYLCMQSSTSRFTKKGNPPQTTCRNLRPGVVSQQLQALNCAGPSLLCSAECHFPSIPGTARPGKPLLPAAGPDQPLTDRNLQASDMVDATISGSVLPERNLHILVLQARGREGDRVCLLLTAS